MVERARVEDCVYRDDKEVGKGLDQGGKGVKDEGEGLSTIAFDDVIVKSTNLLEEMYSFATTLENQLQVIHGFVHPIWALGSTSQSYSASGFVKGMELSECGLRSVCPSFPKSPRKRSCLAARASVISTPPLRDSTSLASRSDRLSGLLASATWRWVSFTAAYRP